MARAVKCLLLLVALSLCTSGSTAQTFYELTKECLEKQKVFETIWNRLLEDGEITKYTTELRAGGERALYKFTGEKVLSMSLHEIFIMLQNYRFLNFDSDHTFFEVPIGGENFLFRLGRGRFPDLLQIAVHDADGNPVRYDKMKKILDRANVRDVAEQMLTSLNELIGGQTSWREPSADIREKMRLLMVITQVAEAARPTDESFCKVEEIMKEVKRIEISKSFDRPKKNFSKILLDTSQSVAVFLAQT